MKLRKLLFPFSILYGAAVFTRNKLYDFNFFNSEKYAFPLICVGNLSVGGTGKSPMVEYLLKLLKNNYSVATLSRGYGRSSRGFYLLEGNEAAEKTGDEPLQFKNKFHDVLVAVDEDRRHGIEQLLNLKKPDVIILDDAFQHRKVTAGLNILLTTYHNLYAEDLLLPAGNLREGRGGADRAEMVVVTKCPPEISETQMKNIEDKLKLKPHQQVFFSTIKYAENLRNASGECSFDVLRRKSFVLVSGIANPAPLVSHLEKLDLQFEHLEYGDHHQFSSAEIKRIDGFDTILSTEKDFMRLKGKISEKKLFYLPIEVSFSKCKNLFDEKVLNFVNEKMGR